MNIFQKLFKSKPFQPYLHFGEEGLKELVFNFYQTMESDPKAKECLHVHKLENGKVPDEVKLKLFEFLSGWTGGPNLFVQNRGAPRMRARHIGFSIGEKERDQWLYCMDKALDKSGKKLSKKNKQIMMNSFRALAYRIQNA